MEERGIADDVHIRMLCNEFPQTLHGIFVGFRLAHIKCDLMLEIRPAVGGGIVHMHRVPDEVGKETHGILMERHRLRSRCHPHSSTVLAAQADPWSDP